MHVVWANLMDSINFVDVVENVATSAAVQKTTTVGTTAGGISVVMDWLPGGLGLITSIIGILASLAVMFFAYRRDHRERSLQKRQEEKHELEKQILEEQFAKLQTDEEED